MCVCVCVWTTVLNKRHASYGSDMMSDPCPGKDDFVCLWRQALCSKGIQTQVVFRSRVEVKPQTCVHSLNTWRKQRRRKTQKIDEWVKKELKLCDNWPWTGGIREKRAWHRFKGSEPKEEEEGKHHNADFLLCVACCDQSIWSEKLEFRVLVAANRKKRMFGLIYRICIWKPRHCSEKKRRNNGQKSCNDVRKTDAVCIRKSEQHTASDGLSLSKRQTM